MREEKTVAQGASEKSVGTSPGGPQPGTNLVTADVADLEGKVKAAMRTVYDPEIPINIYELGLIYGLQVEPEGKVHVQMTLTAPSCPEAASIPARVEAAVRAVPGVKDVKVELVWEPPWTPARMSEAAKLQLGFLY